LQKPTTQIQVLSWKDAERGLFDRWSELVTARSLNPTLDPHWMSTVLESHELTESARIAVSLEDGAMRCVFAFTCNIQRVYGIPLRTVDACSNAVSYHAELLADEAMLAATLRAAHRGGWDLFRMRNVADDGPTAKLLAQAATNIGSALITQPTESSPYLSIVEDWPSYLKTRNTKFRSNITRATKKFAPESGARLEWFEDSAGLERLLADMLTIEEVSWKRSAGHAVSRRPHEERYYRTLLPVLAARNALMANVLYVNDTPVAYNLCCLWNKWAGHLKTSFDSSINDAGWYVISTSVERAFARGASEYDFLGDAAQHKLKWTQSVRPHRDYWLYSKSARARLVGALKRWRARSAA
jgi:hypothetical protein